MKQELEDKLKADFPELFERLGSFDCGDGWYRLIHELSEKISAVISKIDPESYPSNSTWPLHAVQVKEKYGTLRFYMNLSGDEIEDLIYAYEEKSGETCEVCGKPGETRSDGWISTLCDEHHNKRTVVDKGVQN